tara:strand:+ start:1383 stop:1640 length:258 start_codon:yes stop_codon:yes gene_type:complete
MKITAELRALIATEIMVETELNRAVATLTSQTRTMDKTALQVEALTKRHDKAVELIENYEVSKVLPYKGSHQVSSNTIEMIKQRK